MRFHAISLFFLSGLFSFTGTARAAAYTYTVFNPSGAIFSPTSINNADEVGGSYFGTGGYRGFLYNVNTGVFQTVNFPGTAGATIINGINNTGQFIGQLLASGGPFGFLNTNGVFTLISGPGGSGATLTGINDAGQIVGTSSNGSFLYSQGTLTPLSFNPVGINNAGQIVGTFPGEGSVLYSQGTFTPLNINVLGINNVGQILGTTKPLYPGEPPTTVVLNPDGTLTIVPLLNSQAGAIGINDAGQILGIAVENGYVGFVATPVPEPASLLLLASGLLLLGWKKRCLTWALVTRGFAVVLPHWWRRQSSATVR